MYFVHCRVSLLTLAICIIYTYIITHIDSMKSVNLLYYTGWTNKNEHACDLESFV